MPAKRRAFAVLSHFFKRACGNAKVASRLRCIQEWTGLVGHNRADIAAIMLGHRFTVSECGYLYVSKFQLRGRAKMAARQNRQAGDYAPETA
jgi:hypothetical protein